MTITELAELLDNGQSVQLMRHGTNIFTVTVTFGINTHEVAQITRDAIRVAVKKGIPLVEDTMLDLLKKE